MTHPLAHSSGSAAYRGFNPTNKGRGYLPFDTLTERNAIGGGFETTGTAAQTGGNGDDKWERFFGTPPYTTWQRDNYSDLGHENYQLPTAYIGRNLHIEKLLNVSIASQDDFYTRVLLPWKVYDGMKITFSKWSGFDHMMYQIPEEVPAPQIQTKFESGEAYQQRYGLAFKMEHGFQRTEMGRQAYTMNLQIITQAVLRTVYSRIMQVLVHNQNWLQVLANRYFPSRMALAREVSKTSVNAFGCLQKETFGLQIVMNSIQKLFEARQLQAPDSIVLPHGCMAYMSLAKPENRIFALCGALAEKLNVDPKRELAVNVFGNNLQVFEHRPMNVSDSPHEVSVLTRNRDVGNVWRLFRSRHSENGGLLSNETAIRVIDHDKQRWATLTLADALSRCGVWKKDIRLSAGAFTGTDSPNRHINVDSADLNPLMNKHVIGDLISIKKTKYGNAATFDDYAKFGTMSPGAQARSFAHLGKILKLNTASDAFEEDTTIPVNVPTSYKEYIDLYRKNVEIVVKSSASTAKAAYPDMLADEDMPIQLTTDTIKYAADVIMAKLRKDPAFAAIESGVNGVAAGDALAGAASDGSLNLFKNLKTMMPHNTITDATEFAKKMGGNFVGSVVPAAVVPTAMVGASMEDLVGTLQESVASQAGGFEGTNAEFDTIAAGISDILERANDWTDKKRYQVGKAIEQHAGDFAKSAAKLAALRDCTDAGARSGLTKDYVKALGSDFKSKWSKINATQKEIGRRIDEDAAAMPVGALAGTNASDASAAGASIIDSEHLMQLPLILGWIFDHSGWTRCTKEVAKYWLHNFLDFDTIVALDHAGIPTPFGALVFRPFQAFNMGSAIVMKSGEQTGFTAVGNSDFQLGDNVTNKTHLGHFTFYFEPVVHEPNHIMIARDICFMGYHGGAGAAWFADDEDGNISDSGGWKDIVQKIQGANICRPSLLSALAFAHENTDQYFMDPMSIHGTFDRSSILNDLQEGSKPHYASSVYYKSMLDSEISNGLDEATAAATGGMFHNPNTSGICYQGLQCSRDADGKWEDYTANTGHLGKAESLDSSLVWSGQIATKTSVNYEKAGNSVSLFNKYT